MIRADRLTKRYGTVLALDQVSFEVAKGEVLGFLGPNGAGKTTALRILSGYLPPTDGGASVAGLDLTRQSLAARKRLGYLPEAFVAPPELRVSEYLRFRAGLKGLAVRQRRTRVQELAERLGFDGLLRRTFGTLSKGYRQRVGLADALLGQPEALLLDEPFSGLDPLQRQEFRRLLRELAQNGAALLFSSHVLPEVEEVADRVLILHQGTSRAEGTYSELCRAALRDLPLRVVTEGDADALERAFRSNEVLAAACPMVGRNGRVFRFRPESAQARDLLFHWLSDRSEPVTEFRAMEPSLEDLFERVVGEDRR